MKLKLLIYKARLNGVPVYFITLVLLYMSARHFSYPPVPHASDDLQKYLKFDEGEMPEVRILNPQEIQTVRTAIDLINYEREIFNREKFGEMTGDTTVVLVQVQRDAERLQHLVVQLAQVRDINTTLLVFSHSFYDHKINDLILSINFCRVTQIFYPFSNQLNPDKFPGASAEDCPNDWRKKKQREKVFCIDRDAAATEHKHHWWWKAHFVFSEYEWSPRHRASVVFLEESDYVLPDLVHMLRYAETAMSTIPRVHLMSLGRPLVSDVDYDVLIVDSWRPPHDVGLAFNSTTWRKIVQWSASYCVYDDVSWSYSLLNLIGKFGKSHGDMVTSLAPRVMSTRMFPSGRVAAKEITKKLQRAKLFPENVRAVMLHGPRGRVSNDIKIPPKGNGGWSDVRDHLMCLDPILTTTDGYSGSDQFNSSPGTTKWPISLR